MGSPGSCGRRRQRQGRIEPGDERGRLEPDEDLAGCIRSRPDLRLVGIEQLRHVEPAERLVPGEAQVAPGMEGFPVEGEGVGGAAIEGGDARPDGPPVRLDRRAVEPGGIEGREIGPGRGRIVCPQRGAGGQEQAGGKIAGLLIGPGGLVPRRSRRRDDMACMRLACRPTGQRPLDRATPTRLADFPASPRAPRGPDG